MVGGKIDSPVDPGYGFELRKSRAKESCLHCFEVGWNDIALDAGNRELATYSKNCLSRYSREYIFVEWRRDDLVVIDEEHVGSGRLGYVSVPVDHDPVFQAVCGGRTPR